MISIARKIDNYMWGGRVRRCGGGGAGAGCGGGRFASKKALEKIRPSLWRRRHDWLGSRNGAARRNLPRRVRFRLDIRSSAVACHLHIRVLRIACAFFIRAFGIRSGIAESSPP